HVDYGSDLDSASSNSSPPKQHTLDKQTTTKQTSPLTHLNTPSHNVCPASEVLLNLFRSECKQIIDRINEGIPVISSGESNWLSTLARVTETTLTELKQETNEEQASSSVVKKVLRESLDEIHRVQARFSQGKIRNALHRCEIVLDHHVPRMEYVFEKYDNRDHSIHNYELIEQNIANSENKIVKRLREMYSHLIKQVNSAQDDPTTTGRRSMVIGELRTYVHLLDTLSAPTYLESFSNDVETPEKLQEISRSLPFNGNNGTLIRSIERLREIAPGVRSHPRRLVGLEAMEPPGIAADE
ncbi:MAG: hypothetical protein ABEJ65_03530, partial [bacterium]